MIDSPDGDQLTLDLGAQSVVGASSLPWGGRSPRALTKGYKRFILKAQAEKSMGDSVRDENQYDLWLPIREGPWVYTGAPLLRELRVQRG